MTDKIYVDLLLTNSVTQNASHPRIQFFESRSQPIVQNTSDYRMSITRFSLNTQLLPIFIPTMITTTQTIYSITMTYGNSTNQQYMKYASQNKISSSEPEYLYVMNYQYVVYLINQCFSDCLNGLLNKPEGCMPPTLSLDLSTQLLTLEYDPSYFGYNESNKINIYFNFAMNSLLNSFPTYNIGTNNLGKNIQLDFRMGSNNKLFQEFSSVSIWNPVSSIVFTSNLIPVVSSNTPPVQIYKDGILQSTNSTNTTMNILTDFIGNDLVFKNNILYSPTVFRYLDLKPGATIRDMDLQVYWKNKNDGLMIPLYMPSGGSCSIKLMFSKLGYD